MGKIDLDITELRKEYNYDKNKITFSIGDDEFLYEEIRTGRNTFDGRFHQYEIIFNLYKNKTIIKNSTEYVHELADPTPARYGDVFTEKQCNQLR